MLKFLYACFGGFSAGEADKIDKKLKKLYSSIMLLGSSKNTSLIFFGEHKPLMFIGRFDYVPQFSEEPKNIRAFYRPLCSCGLMFLKIYSPVMFLGSLRNISYIPRL
jgi:hypothetical protein